MSITRTIKLRRSFFLMSLTLGAFVCSAAQGETLRFLTQATEESRQAAAQSIDVEGVAYISLDAIGRQLGAECAVDSAGVRIDFGGRSARIGINDNIVQAALKRFALHHPVLRRNEEVLMAAKDVPTFFEHAFGLKVAQDASTSPNDAAISAAADLDPELALSTADEMLNLPAGPAPTVLTVRSLIIDPGHGGSDAGCRGRVLAEKDLTLALAKRIQKLAESTPGLTVLLTRDSDTAKTLDTRVNFAKLTRADIFISLHAGASLAQAAHGFEVFCLPRDAQNARSSLNDTARRTAAGFRLATAVAEGLAQTTSAENRGIRHVKCRILNELPMPGVLLEVGCLTNPSEEELLQTDDYQNRIAQGILAQLRPPAPSAPPQETAP